MALDDDDSSSRSSSLQTQTSRCRNGGMKYGVEENWRAATAANDDDDSPSTQELPDTQPIGDGKEGGGWPDPEKSSDNGKRPAWGMLVAEDSIHFENVALDQKNFSCGKGATNDYVLNESKIEADCYQQFSRVHFKIERIPGSKPTHFEVFLTDLSTNGTFVNKDRVGKNKRRALMSHDIISMTSPEREAFKFIDLQKGKGESFNASTSSITPDFDSLPPDLKARYVVGSLLGKGASGSAYLCYAKDRFDDQGYPLKFCVKVIYKNRSLLPPQSAKNNNNQEGEQQQQTPGTAVGGGAPPPIHSGQGFWSSSRGTWSDKSGSNDTTPRTPQTPRPNQDTGIASRHFWSQIYPEIDILKHLKDRKNSHPNIIGYEETFECTSSIAIVFELANGGELFDYVSEDFDKHQFTEKAAKMQFYQILKGIKYLHDNNICHRDLKLENILLAEKDKRGLIKITDFGLSKLLDNSTAMTTYVGTPSYIAPEVLRNSIDDDPQKHNSYTVKADMWSLGCILYSLICGSPAFHGGSEGTEEQQDRELRRRIFAGEYVTHDDQWMGISEDCHSLLHSLLVLEPSRRISAGTALRHPWFTSDPETIQEVEAIARRWQKKTRQTSEVSAMAESLVNSMDLLDGRGDSRRPECDESEWSQSVVPERDSSSKYDSDSSADDSWKKMVIANFRKPEVAGRGKTGRNLHPKQANKENADKDTFEEELENLESSSESGTTRGGRPDPRRHWKAQEGRLVQVPPLPLQQGDLVANRGTPTKRRRPENESTSQTACTPRIKRTLLK